MIEDYQATESNGRQLTDNYDKRDKKLDGAESPQNRLYVVFSHGKESGPLGNKIRCLMAIKTIEDTLMTPVWRQI